MATGKDNIYYTQDHPENYICRKCGVPLVNRTVTLTYLGSAFPVKLPACPVCSFVFVPEALATGKISSVEHSLEDK